jgi:hypothetical protein
MDRDLFKELCDLDEVLIYDPSEKGMIWDVAMDKIFNTYNCEYLDDLCKKAPECSIVDLIELGNKLLH